MCVKEFLGFVCGHCSVPTLRQCPLSLSDPYFLPCAMPADRATYMANNCPGCQRAVHKAWVYENEEVHKGQHERRECECEFVFSQEERERRFGASSQQQRYRTEQRKAAEQMVEREQVANTQVYHHDNFSQQGDGGGGARIVDAPAVNLYADHMPTTPRYQRIEGAGAGGRQQFKHLQYRQQQNQKPQHVPSHSQDSVLTADANRYHQYLLPTTPQQTPYQTPQAHHGTPARPQAADASIMATDGAVLQTHSGGPSQLVLVAPIFQQQQEIEMMQQHYNYQLMLMEQQSHGYSWYPGQSLPALPPPLQSPHRPNKGRPMPYHTMNSRPVRQNSEPSRIHSRQVSPRTRLDSVSEASSRGRGERKDSGSKRGRQRKKNKKGSAFASSDNLAHESVAQRRHS